MKNSIISTGKGLPKRKVTNKDLTAFLDTSDEWITTRTGISTRYISEDETTSDLAFLAAKDAIEKINFDVNKLELIICATVTPDTRVPTVASNVRTWLNAPECPAFDINVACSGFVYALSVADSMMKTMGYKHALVIGADSNSQLINWDDRSTAVVFGDGSGAVILSANEDSCDSSGIISSFLKTTPDTGDSLVWKSDIASTPFNNKSDDIPKEKVTMDGQKVMRFAVKACVRAINKILEDGGLTLDDVTLVVPHQANKRIVDSALKSLGYPAEKFFLNIEHFANTSAGSIPLAFNQSVEEGLIKKGDYVILVAFGGGLSSGAVLLKL